MTETVLFECLSEGHRSLVFLAPALCHVAKERHTFDKLPFIG